MRTKIILFMMIASLFLMGGMGCEKKEQDTKPIIEGKWSLMKQQRAFSQEKTFEVNEVSCIFNSKGLVEIKSTLTPSPFLPEGTYSYSLVSEKKITINNVEYDYTIEKNKLSLSHKAYLDGDIFEFRRVTDK